MAAKYILNPDGTFTDGDAAARQNLPNGDTERSINDIKFVNTKNPPFYAISGTVVDPTKIDVAALSTAQSHAATAPDKLFYPYSWDATEVLFNPLGNNQATDKITNVIENNENFDFVRPENERETIRSFKQMYSWQDATNDNQIRNFLGSDVVTENGVFATEFEMLTGYRFKIGEIPANLANNTTLGAILYLVGSIVRFAIIELIVSLNKGSLGSRKTFESSSLLLGSYTINEYDIISKYLIERLHYPFTHQDTFSLDKNFVCFLIGFNEYFSPDSFLDYKVLSGLMNKNGALVNRGLRDGNNNIIEDIFGINVFLPLLDTLIEGLLASLTNQTNLKRFQLLMKKFFQEKYWINNQLYKAKNKDEFSVFFAEFSDYNFKFLIERINVGIKLFDRYYLGVTYDIVNEEIDNPLTRTSSNRVKANKDSEKLKLKESLGMLPAQSLLSTNFLISHLLNENNRGINKFNISGNKFIESNHEIKVTNKSKISSDDVRLIEDKLECEYMPFYFHDLRTNEVLPFHAFLESISDSFQPDYNVASGYGRIDEVRSYIKTTRNISFNFIIAAMCAEDHDLMWYNINKLVMMVYPQWSGAFTAYDDKGIPKDFKYPFTQVPTASPLIRVRVGDVIKSNYSRSSLSRLHGVGNRFKKDNPQDDLKKRINVEDSEFELKKITKGVQVYVSAGLYKTEYLGGFEFKKLPYVNLLQETICEIVEIRDNHLVVNYDPNLMSTAIELNSSPFNIIVDKNKVKLVGYGKADSDYNKIKKEEFSTKISDFLSPTSEGSEAQNAQPAIEYKVINPITKAYESGMSRGLAGFITNLTIDYNDMKWETTKIGSKAPMMVKVQVSFAPIHDIPPGLDENGMMRAPIYNAGQIMNTMFGDPHDTDIKGNGLDKVKDAMKNFLFKNKE